MCKISFIKIFEPVKSPMSWMAVGMDTFIKQDIPASGLTSTSATVVILSTLYL